MVFEVSSILFPVVFGLENSLFEGVFGGPTLTQTFIIIIETVFSAEEIGTLLHFHFDQGLEFVLHQDFLVSTFIRFTHRGLQSKNISNCHYLIAYNYSLLPMKISYCLKTRGMSP